MRPKAKGFISRPEADYIFLLLGHPEPAGKERGLERLCRLYQRGLRLRDPHAFRQHFNGMLYVGVPSVRRWTLNAIGLAGSKDDNLHAVMDAIDRDRSDPDIFAAAIGALVALTNHEDATKLFKKAKVDVEGPALLAAAQQADSYKDELAKRRVKIEIASASELRLASVLVGLDKAPEHLFDLKYKNSGVIGSLNQHDDETVGQYSVWAICERGDLGLKNLGVPLKDIEGQPDRVRGYTFKIVVSESKIAEEHREYIELGSRDKSERARIGLAEGLSNSYFEGIEEISLDWLDRESRQDVRDGLIDHMVTFSDRSPLYREKALDEYRSAGVGAVKRARMEAAAEGLPIYAEFKRIAIEGESLSLFGSQTLFGGTVVNNISGQNVNVGVIAGDDATVYGGVAANQATIGQVGVQLAELLALLERTEKDAAIQEGQRLAQEASQKPTKGTVGKLLDWMRNIRAGAEHVVATGDSFGKILGALEGLSNALPI